MPGMGAVATTAIAGVLLARRGLAPPVGSLTQMGEAGRLLSLAKLEQLEFGAWDIFPDDAWESATNAKVLEPRHLELVREELQRIRPMKGVFSPEYVRRLNGTHVKQGGTKAELVEQLREDIRTFIKRRECDRGVAVWCGSTEVHTRPGPVHATVASFEAGLKKDDPGITPSQMYAWACLREGVPFANGSPNLAVDIPAAEELAREVGLPIAGKDFKTGQTMMKTVIAPALKARRLGVRGWFSTNILGNRDGEVLDDPDAFRSKELTKGSVLKQLLSASDSPALYGELFHKVRIEYYPPRGDEKEAWDNIDLFGWLGYPMQLKLNFLCRDSILAAPIVLDLALLLDAAHRAGRSGRQEWMSFFFKSPMSAPGMDPEHDLFRQEQTLFTALRELAAVDDG